MTGLQLLLHFISPGLVAASLQTSSLLSVTRTPALPMRSPRKEARKYQSTWFSCPVKSLLSCEISPLFDPCCMINE